MKIPRFSQLVIVVLFSSNSTFAQTTSTGDQTFQSTAHKVTFHYPAGWVTKDPQLTTTLALLYATDASSATCNMNSSVFSELEGLSEQKLDSLRKANHTREYFERTFGNTVAGFSITRHWRAQFGQKEAGAIEYRYKLMVGDTQIQVESHMTATFANGRRYTLNCNAPRKQGDSSKHAFDYIRSTTLFLR